MEYEYHGYTIKRARRDIEGVVYEVYKDGELICWHERKKVVEEVADWHAANN